jgi:beta-lactamase regulating signal transducer with metallopeptidase domain
MPGIPPGSPPAGFFLSLLTESFAVRAFLGSVLAVVLSAVAVRLGYVRAPGARRLLVLAPALAAAAAAVASLVEAEAYLPQLWVASTDGQPGRVLELLGELRVISSSRGVDVLVLLWMIVATVLVTRRLWGVAATRRLLRRAQELPQDHPAQTVAERLAAAMRTPQVALRTLEDCPGGALTTRTRRPVVVIDPDLLSSLDAQEIEGLLAHEIAHTARRDTLLGTVVGLFADVTFFLPTVHAVERSLRREREEGADELASRHTGRPGALASSILKVWEGSAPSSVRLSACGAVASGVAVAPWLLRRPRHDGSKGARVIAARVERLVAPPPLRTGVRRVAEVVGAVTLVLAAMAASVVLPQWIATDLDAYSLAFGYVPPPAESVESPAFATFRALAPPREIEDLRGYERVVAASARSGADAGASCPCVETQAQWLSGRPARVSHRAQSMAWQRTSSPAWDIRPAPGSVRARPLLTLVETGPRVGFFVMGETEP